MAKTVTEELNVLFCPLPERTPSCALCIVDSKGTMLLERELPCGIKDIAECLARFPQRP